MVTKAKSELLIVSIVEIVQPLNTLLRPMGQQRPKILGSNNQRQEWIHWLFGEILERFYYLDFYRTGLSYDGRQVIRDLDCQLPGGVSGLFAAYLPYRLIRPGAVLTRYEVLEHEMRLWLE